MLKCIFEVVFHSLVHKRKLDDCAGCLGDLIDAQMRKEEIVIGKERSLMHSCNTADILKLT